MPRKGLRVRFPCLPLLGDSLVTDFAWTPDAHPKCRIVVVAVFPVDALAAKQPAGVDRHVDRPGFAGRVDDRSGLIAAVRAGYFVGVNNMVSRYLYTVNSIDFNPLRHGIDTVADVTPMPLTGKLVSNVSTNGSHAAVSSP